jgi:hypothetical protein
VARGVGEEHLRGVVSQLEALSALTKFVNADGQHDLPDHTPKLRVLEGLHIAHKNEQADMHARILRLLDSYNKIVRLVGLWLFGFWFFLFLFGCLFVLLFVLGFFFLNWVVSYSLLSVVGVFCLLFLWLCECGSSGFFRFCLLA